MTQDNKDLRKKYLQHVSEAINNNLHFLVLGYTMYPGYPLVSASPAAFFHGSIGDIDGQEDFKVRITSTGEDSDSEVIAAVSSSFYPTAIQHFTADADVKSISDFVLNSVDVIVQSYVVSPPSP